MSTPETVTAPPQPQRSRAGTGVLAAVVAVVALSFVAAMLYFSFARAPVAIAGFVIVGPEVEAQPATRVESSYQTALKAGGAAPSKTEFATIKFYRNVPWGDAEQNAPVGAR